jgi:hypothetical protein
VEERRIEVTDTTPGTVPPPPLPDTPPPPPDTKPKRPTTRAERRAVAEANKARKATKPDKAPAASKPRKASLETRLAGNIATLGTVLAAAGGMASPALSADGVLVVQHSASIAAALDKVAKDDPKVAAALERMLTVGTWSGLIAALMPLVLGIAANHGAIPPQLAAILGATTPPEDAGQEPAAAGTVSPGGIA